MSLIDVEGADKQASAGPRADLPSPSLSIELPSNNPFRNRAASPNPYNNLASPHSPSFNFGIPSTAPERPTSRNPFLDQTERPEGKSSGQAPTSPVRGMAQVAGRRSPTKPALYGNTAVLLNNLSLDDKPTAGVHSATATSRVARPQQSENVPPTVKSRFGPSGHPAHRTAEQQRLASGAKPRGPPQGLDVFADPPEAVRHRRPRRNSESSIVDKSGKLLDPDDQRRRRERRHKEREARHQGDGKSRIHGAPSSKSKKPSQRLDVIDSLDVTSIYGTGLFHHDGPFDACNPHRNRKGSQRAPMKAFAKDSANNALGGSGPVNKNIDLAQFHGRGTEGFTDFSTSGVNSVETELYTGAGAPGRMGPGPRPAIDRTASFNPTALVEPVYGDETVGLGATTFLEGAPAPRTAIQRRESESDTGFGSGGGLGRKISLAQKIRGISSTNRAGRVISPDRAGPTSPISPTMETAAQGAGGMPKIQETNPFFNNHDDAYEKKGARIQIAEEQNRVEGGVGRARAMSSPKRANATGLLERRVTNDGTGVPDNTENKSGSGGFLSRVKSLKGGRRTRPER